MNLATSQCTLCGACCAAHRVVFGREELDDWPGGVVPAALANPLDRQRACMRGTGSGEPRCIALNGTIGTNVSCLIYERRPSPCRSFAPDAATGHGSISCGEARRRHGLPPLPGSYDAAMLF
jgi:Fe-S-cluster containining protein